MILIPLGFAGKLPRFPFMTVAIAAGICLISIPRFSRLEKDQSVRMQTLWEIGYGRKVSEVVRYGCREEKLTPLECAASHELIARYFSDPSSVGPQFPAIVRKHLKGDNKAAHAEAILRIANFVKLMTGRPERFPDAIKSYAKFAEIEAAYEAYQTRVAEYQKQSRLLTPSNKGVVPLLLSQWLHAGWWHLVGNLLVFLALAMVLEARLGSFVFFGFYLLGGTIGMLTQLLFMDDPITPLVGASANISAVTGGFFVFFFHRPVRVLASLIIYNKILLCPTWLIVPVLYVCNDIIGTAHTESGVAHFAHLGGFAFGAIAAFAIKKVDDLNPAYLYGFEYDWHLEMRKAESLPEKLAIAERILKYNSENQLVLEESLRLILESARDAAIDENSDRFLKQNFSQAINLAIRRKKVARLETMMQEAPLRLSFIRYLSDISQSNLLALIDRQLKHGEWLLALRLFDVFRTLYPKTSGAAAMEGNLRKILMRLTEAGTNLSALNDYLYCERRTTFSELLQEFAPTQSGVNYGRSG